MKEEYFTISELVMMSGLSDRTIRNYMKDGRLLGSKQDGKWIFTKQQIGDFFQNRFVKETLFIKQAACVDEFLGTYHKQQPSACIITDYPFPTEEEAEKLSIWLCDKLGKLPEQIKQMSFHYDHKHHTARLILIGDPEMVAKLIVEIAKREA